MKNALFTKLFLFLLTTGMYAQTQDMDHSSISKIVTGTNGPIYAILFQEDGKVLVGGAFDAYNGISRNGINRLNPDGTLDATFVQGPAANDAVYSIALQSDGKILVGGLFTTFDSETRNHLARLNTDGTLDISFNPSTDVNGIVDCINVQTDGKIRVASSFISKDDNAKNQVIRMHSDGSLDTTFERIKNATLTNPILPIDEKVVVVKKGTLYNLSSACCQNTTFTTDEKREKEVANQHNLTAYPNPSSGLFHIKSSATLENASITITDCNGKMVEQLKVDKLENNLLNLSNLKDGIYILTIQNETVNYSQKLVKQ